MNKDKQENQNRKNTLITAFIIVMLILSFYETCIKKDDKDPDKAEYEMNSRLRLN